MHPIAIKRIYESPDPADGDRILVDRLWPRGIKKEAAALTLWMKDIAPSPGLRVWFGHEAEKFEEFSARYTAELEQPDKLPYLDQILELARNNPVTLVYAAKDGQYNHAIVLQRFLYALLPEA